MDPSRRHRGRPARPRPSGSKRCAASLLDHFRARGYRLVQPPLVEHLDSLLTGTGRDLELQTFKVVDPLSGRLLGVRADITPQVARIDAHLLNEPGVTRLCYAGSVLRTVAGGPAQDARGGADRRRALRRAAASPATAKCSRCCCRRSRAAGVRGLHLDLGHVGVYRALADGAGIAGNGEDSRALRGAAREGRAGRRRAHREAAGRVARRARRAADALRSRATRCSPRRARGCPTRRRSRNALAALDALARSRGAAGRGAAHRSRRPARLSLPERRDLLGVHRRRTDARSATAAATTASARRSGARGRPPASRSTCGSSPSVVAARIRMSARTIRGTVDHAHSGQR